MSIDYGRIKMFIQIDVNMYCIVNILKKNRSLILDPIIENELDMFCIVAKSTNKFKITNMKNIKNKCAIMYNNINNENEIFLNLATDLTEHD